MTYTKNALLYAILVLASVSTHLYASEPQVKSVSLDDEAQIKALERLGIVEEIAAPTNEERREILIAYAARFAINEEREGLNSSESQVKSVSSDEKSETKPLERPNRILLIIEGNDEGLLEEFLAKAKPLSLEEKKAAQIKSDIQYHVDLLQSKALGVPNMDDTIRAHREQLLAQAKAIDDKTAALIKDGIQGEVELREKETREFRQRVAMFCGRDTHDSSTNTSDTSRNTRDASTSSATDDVERELARIEAEEAYNLFREMRSAR